MNQKKGITAEKKTVVEAIAKMEQAIGKAAKNDAINGVFESMGLRGIGEGSIAEARRKFPRVKEVVVRKNAVAPVNNAEDRQQLISDVVEGVMLALRAKLPALSATPAPLE